MSKHSSSQASERRPRPFAGLGSPTFNTAQITAAPVAPQYQLEIGPVDDAYEREADAIATAVVGGGELEGELSSGALGVQRACASCQGDEELRRSPSDGGGATPTLSPQANSRISRARASSGQPLPDSARSYFEPRFNADFGDVRVHQGAEASSLSNNLGARAFTVGRDLFFGSGQLDYNSERGRHLVAHELTHTIQQSGAVRRKSEK
ncbi:hypothetical protein DB30_02509 [Enhygromyxa salina]|uniref:eCIS core domain-containing protein n=1 Tax=Enhygromyxa salina TaxID=215803 RepID=A0A0C2D3T5_9BACT|nr:hypothetical protein DB30_02509 [Enhygromyxa salina]